MAVNVGGSGEWGAGDVDSLRGSASFSAGSALGLDTTDGGFTYGSNLVGSLGLTKLGANTTSTLTGMDTYTGATIVQAGTLVLASDASLGNTALSVGSGAVFTNDGMLTGSTDVIGTVNGAGTFGAVKVENGGAFGATGTISGTLTVNGGGTVMLSGGTLTVAGGVTNNGTMRFEHGATLVVPSGSTFVNNGLLDVISGGFTPSGNFTNNGVVLDSRVVVVKSVSRSEGVVSVVINSYTGHAYQLQQSNSLTSDSFTNLGSPLIGTTGMMLTFTDSSPAATQSFYHVQVDQ